MTDRALDLRAPTPSAQAHGLTQSDRHVASEHPDLTEAESAEDCRLSYLVCIAEMRKRFLESSGIELTKKGEKALADYQGLHRALAS